MSSCRVGFALGALCAALQACSSGGGIFQPPKSSGVIVASLPGTSDALTTSPSAPLIVNNAFSVTLREDNYAAAFSASIVSYTAPAPQACYTVTMDSTQKVALFTPRAVAPCTQPGNDVEGALFQDQQGHKLLLYFENAFGVNGGPIQARLVTNGLLLNTTASSPAPVKNAFSVVLSEPGYAGPFTATIVSFTAATTQSCYTAAMDATSTIATFTPRSAPALSGSPTSPCSQPGSDVEGALFQDIHGNSSVQYFQNT
jgi:hypothetical protein